MAAYSKIQLASNLIQLGGLLRDNGKLRDALKYFEEALSDLADSKIKAPETTRLLSMARIFHAVLKAQIGDYLAAAAEAATLVKSLPMNSHGGYFLACAYSFAAKAARNDATKDTPTREKLAKEYLKQSADLIQNLFKSKYFEPSGQIASFWHDADLETLREDPDFRKWLDANIPKPKSDK
jgi:tetratricopeptide (TPR) repeat protein